MSHLPKALSEGLFNPEFLPENLDLNEFVRVVEQVPTPQPEKSIPRSNRGLLSSGTSAQMPLTPAEAEAVDARIDAQIVALEATVARIASIRAQIDEHAMDTDGSGSELSFNMNLEKRPRLRRMVKKVFGHRSNVMTYSMYKEALEMRRVLEEEETQSYLTQDDE